MKDFSCVGLEEEVQYRGHLDLQTFGLLFMGICEKHCLPISNFLPLMNSKVQITAATQTVDSAMLYRTWLEISYRLDVLLASNGAHIEIVAKNIVKNFDIFFTECKKP
ncbi:hypothetical protein AVEN_271525-1 [Araneus ventricosus]|uniref:Uncharacterized protein n=1 Tax=Araneus ventricosus TaxID=182803 RepID=A0A4Y2G1Q3_ARAVE|nr:hypothetical protein AVEN_271525-1 [Araneus ventricosus]